MTNSAKLQLGFSPLSKTIVLAKMRDVDGMRIRVGINREKSYVATSMMRPRDLSKVWGNAA